MKVYFDLDGVLADYDKAANRVLQTDNHYKFDFIHGPAEYWRRINEDTEFFARMDMMPGARLMLKLTEHVSRGIITALPKTNGDRVAAQKREWVERHIGPLEVITCQTHEKPNYCQPGDILIDDRAVNKAAWEAKRGHYILHTDPLDTIHQLNLLGAI